MEIMNTGNNYTKKASVLAFTLIMMGMLLLVGLSLSGAVVTDRKTAIDSGKSLRALQVAESVANELTKGISGATVTTTIDSLMSCPSGSSEGESYYVLFEEIGGTPLVCSDLAGKVAKIKVYGTYAGATRVIDRTIGK